MACNTSPVAFHHERAAPGLGAERHCGGKPQILGYGAQGQGRRSASASSTARHSLSESSRYTCK